LKREGGAIFVALTMKPLPANSFLSDIRGRGWLCARALGFSIFTDGETMDDLRKNVKEAARLLF
jgi:hypothetical protein